MGCFGNGLDLGETLGRRIFPQHQAQENGHFDRDIIEHQGEQRFIGPRIGPEQAWDQCIKATAQHGCQGHAHPVDDSRRRFRQLVGHIGGKNRAHDHLAFPADVPEPHRKADRQAQCDNQERDGNGDGIDQAADRAKGPFGDRQIGSNRVKAHGSHDQAG